jgi:hypothetical protein
MSGYPEIGTPHKEAPMTVQKIERWICWLVAKPLAWILFVGWLVVSFVVTGLFCSGRAVVRHYWPTTKRA